MRGDETSDRRASLGFEKQLWEAADLLRGAMDPAEYKHVVLGLLFLKYISDAFEERREELGRLVAGPESDYYVEDEEAREEELSILREDRDEYALAHVFWVPAEARWEEIQAKAKIERIGKRLDDAMDAIERENPTLKGVLPKVYARPGLDKDNLGKLIDLFSNLGVGGREQRAKDVLGRVYEYFLSRFASAEGKGGGEFYTPQSVVRVLETVPRQAETLCRDWGETNGHRREGHPLARIVLDEHGVPVIAGTPLKVVQIISRWKAYGETPEEIAADVPVLSLDQVNAAFEYYEAHREEIDENIERRVAKVERLREETGQPPVAERLRKFR